MLLSIYLVLLLTFINSRKATDNQRVMKKLQEATKKVAKI